MLYECDYFKVTGSFAEKHPHRGTKPSPDSIYYTAHINFAGQGEMTGVSPSRIEAVFKAFAKALGSDIARRAAQQPPPAVPPDYGAEWRSVAKLFRNAARSRDVKIARRLWRDQQARSARASVQKLCAV